MDPSRFDARELARELAQRALRGGDASGWFDEFYRCAEGDEGRIPWADIDGHPLLVEWLGAHAVAGRGRRAAVVGCGLGEDAEQLQRSGFAVTAFDVSATAVDWCRRRFERSAVEYVCADLFALPSTWLRAFDFVLESYTLQSLPTPPRRLALAAIAALVAPAGELLLITRGRTAQEPAGSLPWPLLRAELDALEQHGLRFAEFEDLPLAGPPERPGRHFRAWLRSTR